VVGRRRAPDRRGFRLDLREPAEETDRRHRAARRASWFRQTVRDTGDHAIEDREQIRTGRRGAQLTLGAHTHPGIRDELVTIRSLQTSRPDVDRE